MNSNSIVATLLVVVILLVLAQQSAATLGDQLKHTLTTAAEVK